MKLFETIEHNGKFYVVMGIEKFPDGREFVFLKNKDGDLILEDKDDLPIL